MRVQVNAILRIVLIVSALLILASVWLFLCFHSPTEDRFLDYSARVKHAS